MKIINEFCQPIPAHAIAFAESLSFTTYMHGYAQEIKLERDSKKYIPTRGLFYSDRTTPKPGFLKSGEEIQWSTNFYDLGEDFGIGITQRTHCPYPVESLPVSCEGCALPPPIFEGQFLRHDVYNFHSHRRGRREYVSVRIGGYLGWLLLSEWTLDKP